MNSAEPDPLPVVDPRPATARSRAFLGAIAVGMALFSVVASSVYFASTLEDAFITFRYSVHFAEGHGWGAWNRQGPRVEGYTTPFWMLVLALCHALSLPIVTSSKILGVLFFLITIAPFFSLGVNARRAPDSHHLPFKPDETFRSTAFVTGVLLATSLPMAWYSTTGMEVTLFTCLSAWLLLCPYFCTSRILWSTLAVLLIFTRPEGIVVVLLVFSLYAWPDVFRRRVPRAATTMLTSAVLAALTLTVFRQLYFGWPLPNTYYAKAAGSLAFHVKHGLAYVSDYVATHWASLAAISAAIISTVTGVSQIKRHELMSRLLLIAFVTCWFGYVVKTGGDNYWAFPFHRHFLHIEPILAFVAAIGLVAITRGRKNWLLAAALLVSTVNNAQVFVTGKHNLMRFTRPALADYPRWSTPPKTYYRWFLQFRDSNTSIAAPVAGELPFLVDAIHIDLLGLNDEHIAHQGTFDMSSVIDSKTDMNYVLSRRPDLLASTISAKAIMDGKSPKRLLGGRKQMVRVMFDNPIFHSEYSLVTNGPYQSWDRAIFARTEFCARHSELRCTPVHLTSIARWHR